jgi:hypothetical protein
MTSTTKTSGLLPIDGPFPSDDVKEFHYEKGEKWLRYIRDGFFGYVDNNESKPALLLPCGKYEEAISYKQVLLLTEALVTRPDLLELFLDWFDGSAERPEPIKLEVKRNFAKPPRRARAICRNASSIDDIDFDDITNLECEPFK